MSCAKLSMCRAVLLSLCIACVSCQAPAKASGTDQKRQQGIGGVVTSEAGPEAGAWVIAETNDLPTKLTKIVVTDDQGRYFIPRLPRATYSLWVRGYGLIDSQRLRARPGRVLNLTATVAPSPAAAARYYPALYWYALMEVPGPHEFPGTGADGNHIAESLRSQAQWLELIKTDGCNECHQIGDLATRSLPATLGNFPTSEAAWARRLASGQGGTTMMSKLASLGVDRALTSFAAWTDRIARGELPASEPSRPKGIERNLVITLWDWHVPKGYLHDEISTDKRTPTLNANGAVFGAPEDSTDFAPILDPTRNARSHVRIPVRDRSTPSAVQEDPLLAPSPYWGNEVTWSSQATAHNPMMDELGRVWFTSRIRGADNPDFCKAGSDHPSAKLYPLDSSGRQLSMYDPKTHKFTLIDTCFPTHHLQFAADANNTLWLSTANAAGTGEVVGWLNRKVFDETGDAIRAQGWTAFILDTNGNGKRDEYVEPGAPLDPTKDKRVAANLYGIAISPADSSIWGSVLGFPGAVIRVNPGNNPPATALSEIYEVPWNDERAPVQGFSPRGMDIDRSGVVWTVLASGHLASFDRRKCVGSLNGPKATGRQCPEGWTLYQLPGPQFKGVQGSGSAESSYYVWVDQHNTLGLGADVPVATGNNSDSLLALVDGKFVTLRVPYPMGFYAKGLDGRIDDSAGGWSGRGLWSTYSTRAPWHIEGGKGMTSKVVHFQIRRDPLAP
jgi:hypothetical protein